MSTGPLGLKIFSQRDYRAVLREELEIRQSRNPRYSLRAFSRDLGISHHRLSEILRGKQGLSRPFAKQIAAKLFHSLEAIEYFCDLVSAVHARKPEEKQRALMRIHAIKNKPTESLPSLEAWLDLVQIECRRMGISAEFLLQLGQLSRTQLEMIQKLLSESGLIRIENGALILQYPSAAATSER